MLGEKKSTPFPLLARAPLCSPEGFFYSLLSGTRGPQAEPPLSWDCAQRLWSWDCQEGPPEQPALWGVPTRADCISRGAVPVFPSSPAVRAGVSSSVQTLAAAAHPH